MNTKALVLEEKPNKKALVKVFRKSACEACHACKDGQSCHAEFLLSDSSKTYTLTVDNLFGAKAGDLVELHYEKTFTLGLAVLTFLVPFAVAGVAYLLTDWLADGFWPILVSVISFVLGFFGLSALADKLCAKRMNITVCKILKESGSSRIDECE